MHTKLCCAPGPWVLAPGYQPGEMGEMRDDIDEMRLKYGFPDTLLSTLTYTHTHNTWHMAHVSKEASKQPANQASHPQN